MCDWRYVCCVRMCGCLSCVCVICVSCVSSSSCPLCRARGVSSWICIRHWCCCCCRSLTPFSPSSSSSSFSSPGGYKYKENVRFMLYRKHNVQKNASLLLYILSGCTYCQYSMGFWSSFTFLYRGPFIFCPTGSTDWHMFCIRANQIMFVLLHSLDICSCLEGLWSKDFCTDLISKMFSSINVIICI